MIKNKKKTVLKPRFMLAFLRYQFLCLEVHGLLHGITVKCLRLGLWLTQV